MTGRLPGLVTSIGLFWSPLLKSGAFSSLTAGFLVTVADGLVTVVPRLVEAVLLLTEGLVAVPLERGATPDGLEAVPEGRLTCLSEEAVLLDVVREALEEVPVLLLVVCASTSD